MFRLLGEHSVGIVLTLENVEEGGIPMTFPAGEYSHIRYWPGVLAVLHDTQAQPSF